MSFSEEEKYSEYDYFKMRKLDKIYVSKVFPFKSFIGNLVRNKRFIKKVFEKSEQNEFVKVKGEIVLRSSPGGREQVNVIVVSDIDDKLMSFTLQQFRNNPKSGLKPIKNTDFTFQRGEFLALLNFLSDLKFIDLTDESRFVADGNKNLDKKISLWLNSSSDEEVLLKKQDAQLLSLLSGIQGVEREALLKSLRTKVLSHEDLNILSGRKEGFEIFKNELLKEKQDWNEKDWQSYFEKNQWIFGYGLDYRFLNIVQKEASVSDVDLDGKQTVIADFLMGDSRFTVLVELKRPNTPLFESGGNRSKSWKLSKDITNAVSQILTQKAEWELKSQHEQFASTGKLVEERTIDPKTILIIGNTSQFKGEDRDSRIKAKTFELYRRNSRNIEIVTFDELYDRASFIVNNKKDIETNTKLEIDELPF